MQIYDEITNRWLSFVKGVGKFFVLTADSAPMINILVHLMMQNWIIQTIDLSSLNSFLIVWFLTKIDNKRFISVYEIMHAWGCTASSNVNSNTTNVTLSLPSSDHLLGASVNVTSRGRTGYDRMPFWPSYRSPISPTPISAVL